MHIKLFAYKYNGTYKAEHIIEDLEDEFDGLEYGDVVEDEYQIWEYPNGKIFSIKPDRKVGDKDYYSLPSRGLWLPELKYVRTDQELVQKEYERLKNMPEKPSIWKRLFKKL